MKKKNKHINDKCVEIISCTSDALYTAHIT